MCLLLAADTNGVQSLTPRQVRLLASKGDGAGGARSHGIDDAICNSGGASTVREIDPPYLYNSRSLRERQKARAQSYAQLIAEEGLQPETTCAWPSWQSSLRGDAPKGATGNDNSAVSCAADACFGGDQLYALETAFKGSFSTTAEQRLTP